MNAVYTTTVRVATDVVNAAAWVPERVSRLQVRERRARATNRRAVARSARRGSLEFLLELAAAPRLPT